MKFHRPYASAAFIAACLSSVPVHAQEDQSRPVELVSFDGVHKLNAAARQQVILTQMLEYTLVVDKTGRATDCRLSRKFRQKATTLSFCRPLMKYSKLKPARDARGQPIEGTYTAVIDFRMWMGPDGLEAAN